MLARFIGTDRSCGFRTGEKYSIHSKCKGNAIILQTYDGTLSCIYASVEAILKNWKIYQ